MKFESGEDSGIIARHLAWYPEGDSAQLNNDVKFYLDSMTTHEVVLVRELVSDLDAVPPITDTLDALPNTMNKNDVAFLSNREIPYDLRLYCGAVALRHYMNPDSLSFVSEDREPALN
jgi:hypothetical protein